MSNHPGNSYPPIGAGTPTSSYPPTGTGSPADRTPTGAGSPAHGTETRGALQETKGAVQETVETVKDEATKLVDELGTHGSELGDAAKERAKGFAEEQKSLGADHLDGVARAVRKAAEELRDGTPQLAGHIQDTASAMERVSRTLRERGVGEIAGDITDFARSQPVAFLGASIVAGLALSRFLKSSAEPAQRRSEPSRPESGGSTATSKPATPADTEPSRPTTSYQGATYP